MRPLMMYIPVVALLLASCSKPKGSEYFPEPKVGSRYEYMVEYQLSAFGIGVGVQKATMVLRIDPDETINGRQYHKEVTTFSGIPGADQQIQYLRWSSQGIYSIDTTNREKAEFLETPFPISVGSSWTSKTPNAQANYEATSIETVDLPDRAYSNCLKVSIKSESNDTKSSGTQYLAPGVGIVRIVMNMNGMPMTLTLTKFTK